MPIGFIGLGKLGLPCAEVMSEHRTVYGYDTSPVYSPSLKIVDSLEELMSKASLIFIAVPTPHEDGYGGETQTSHLEPKPFDYSYVIDVLEKIKPFTNVNHIICLISTVLPGTVRKILSEHVLYPEHFIYNPYLIAMGSVKEDFLNPDMIILGAHTKDNYILDVVGAFYKTMCGRAQMFKGTWEEAESYKIFYNTFISMKLSFVNMIQDVSQKLGNMNPQCVTDALANSTKRITSKAYMTPGMGDGGACHPRDNIALRYLAKELDLGYDLFGAIMQSREAQAANLAKFLISIGNKNIVIVGKSYKPNTHLIDGSYSLLVGHYITEYGGTVHYHDDYTKDFYTPNPSEPLTVLIGHWSNYIDRFLDIVPRSSTIVDPWRRISTVFSKPKVVHYGIKDATDSV